MNDESLKKLNELFGSYKAEWLKGKIFKFFAQPPYFVALQDNRPCILQGGRGTGKTTVLRGLSYQGMYALHNEAIKTFDNEEYIGIYYRANTNHVRAFTGGGLNEDEWVKIFGHYFNLTISWQLIQFLQWHRTKSPSDELFSSQDCRIIANSLHIEEGCENFDSLLVAIESALYDFQGRINNIADGNKPKLTLLGDPIRIITERAISLCQFDGKMFFILIDEYENFEDYQQQCLNSFLKHCTDYYTVKIGVRELGWRVKYTLNPNELLNDPADYVLINIEEKFADSSDFNDFAKNVCQYRIEELLPEQKTSYSIEDVLPSLSIDEEARLLDIKNSQLLSQYNSLPSQIKDRVDGLSDLYKFFIAFWAKSHQMSLKDAMESYLNNTKQWDSRYENYNYSLLFKIRKGRGKVGIQKYYAGWSTYLKLANGNIRYVMQLFAKAYEQHLTDNNNISTPISYKNQTEAAQEVGKKNLQELEGLWKNGAKLTKLLLSLGRVFNVLISVDNARVAPEINQFALKDRPSDEIEEIISAAVMHLALIRQPRNKPGDQTVTRDYQYSIHPIFAPYFVFSYRKKRRMEITGGELKNLIFDPQEGIKSILSKKKISVDDLNELPEQLTLFESYYD
jgi:hypothetical protein